MDKHNQLPQYFIVDKAVVSETLAKVVEAKRYLKEDGSLSVSDVVKKVGLSRSAFYKYKDFVFPFYDDSSGKNLTFSFDLKDTTGLLSEVLTAIAQTGANILTINQTLPINAVANIVITIETSHMDNTIQNLFEHLKNVEGLFNFRILARDL